MEDKIIDLLKLCLQAQRCNCNIDFSCNQFGIYIWHFSKYTPDSYDPVIIKRFDAPFVTQDSQATLIDAMEYIKDLIKKEEAINE